MNDQKFKKLDASCHCGSIRLTINLEKPLSDIVRCNCSICSKNKGFGMLCTTQENITVIEGFESVTEYVFNTAEAPHFFCIICGTHTHHKSRNNPGNICLLYTSPSPRDSCASRMPSSA